jgi:protein-disulfide isomerase
MTRLRLGAAAAVLALWLVPAQADEFTDAQKKEIGAVVKQYLIDNPEIIDEALAELKRRQEDNEAKSAQAAIAENGPAIFRSAGDLVVGNPNGKVTMVEFFDYNCGYCKRAFPDVMKMIEADKDLRIVMKEFPILGPGSLYAARAAIASQKQGKYWEYHQALMKHEGRMDAAAAIAIAEAMGLDVARLKTDMEAEDVASVIGGNEKLAQALNIGGTPAFVIDQTLIPGAIGFEGLAEAVKAVRNGGGCKVC